MVIRQLEKLFRGRFSGSGGRVLIVMGNTAHLNVRCPRRQPVWLPAAVVLTPRRAAAILALWEADLGGEAC